MTALISQSQSTNGLGPMRHNWILFFFFKINCSVFFLAFFIRTRRTGPQNTIEVGFLPFHSFIWKKSILVGFNWVFFFGFWVMELNIAAIWCGVNDFIECKCCNLLIVCFQQFSPKKKLYFISKLIAQIGHNLNFESIFYSAKLKPGYI